MEETARIREGMTVYSADGEKLGKIVSFTPTAFVIEKGFFFKKDYVVSYDDVSRISDDEAWLLVDAAQITEDRAAGLDDRMGSPVQNTDDRLAATASRADVVGRSAGGVTQETTIPLAEEELIAEKRVAQAGEVRVRKEVVTEERQVTVPVMREDVHVERVAVNREATGAEQATFREDEVVVPVMEEEVEVRKRPVVREEVRIGKTAHEEQRTASATVRREEVEVDRDEDRDPALRPSVLRDDEDPNTKR